MTVHPLHNVKLLNHKLVACKIHKPSNKITVWVAFQRFHLTIILRPPTGVHRSGAKVDGTSSS